MGTVIEESLARFPKLLAKGNLDGLESMFHNQARDWSGRGLARKIGEVDLRGYQRALALGLIDAEKAVREHEAKAIYFEYDMDNHWHGRFFVCKDYAPASAKDEDWTDHWAVELEGPAVPEFGAFNLEYGFDRTDQAKGCTLYMIARTVASLGRCVDIGSLGPAALCIAYRTQNPIFRLHEGSKVRASR